MLKILLKLWLFLVLSSGLAWGETEILVIQSLRIAPYEEAVKGFRTVCNRPVQRLVLSESSGNGVLKKVREVKPALILAVGVDALTQAAAIKDLPIVYLMVLNPRPLLLKGNNITGVSMAIPPEEQLGILVRVLPQIRNIGLLYDPEQTDPLVKRAREAAEKLGRHLIIHLVKGPQKVPTGLAGMKGKIDIFWMLPDPQLITPETIESMLLFSLGDRIPILSFSEKYVELGALMSIDIDPFDLGVQAGELATKILSGTEVSSLGPVEARKPVLSINRTIARKLGLAVDEKALGQAKIVE